MGVPHTIFDDMAPVGMTCQSMTGFTSAHIAYVYNTYGRLLNPVNRRPSWFRCRDGFQYSITVIRFFLLYVYIHLYPRGSECKLVLRVRGKEQGYDKTTVRRRLMPLAHKLAEVMDEVKWSDRLDPYNHHPLFPIGVTTLWDTAPIYVATPSDSMMNRLLYQPKYGNCVFKVQIAITFTLQIVYFSCLHIGTAHDGQIFKRTRHEHPFEPYEYGIADKIYQAVPELINGHRKEPHRRGQPPPPPLTHEDLLDNSDVDFARSSVARARVPDSARTRTTEPFAGARNQGRDEPEGLPEPARLPRHARRPHSVRHHRHPDHRRHVPPPGEPPARQVRAVVARLAALRAA